MELTKGEQKRIEARLYKLGEGAWFRNFDNLQVKVEVYLYPKVKRYINEDGKRREITQKELIENYHRLRLK